MLEAARATAYAAGFAWAMAGWIFPIATDVAIAQPAVTAAWPADFTLTKARLNCRTRELEVRMASEALEYVLRIHADQFSVAVMPLGKPSGQNAPMAGADDALLVVTSHDMQYPFEILRRTEGAKSGIKILPKTLEYERLQASAIAIMSEGEELRRICVPGSPGGQSIYILASDEQPITSMAHGFVTLRRDISSMAPSPVEAKGEPKPAESTVTWPADFVLTKATLDCAARELDVGMTSGPLEYTLWIGKHARMPDIDRFTVTVTPRAQPSGDNALAAFMDNAVLIVTSNGLESPFDMHGKTDAAKPAGRIFPGTPHYEDRYVSAYLLMVAGGHLRRILCAPENPAARGKLQLGIDNALVKTIAQSFVTLRLRFPK